MLCGPQAQYLLETSSDHIFRNENLHNPEDELFGAECVVFPRGVLDM